MKINKGTKIYDLHNSYNVIITGTIIDMETEKEFNQFDVIADWPLQINILDRSKPVDSLTHEQIAQVLELLQLSGKPTTNCLKLIARSDVYMIKIEKSANI